MHRVLTNNARGNGAARGGALRIVPCAAHMATTARACAAWHTLYSLLLSAAWRVAALMQPRSAIADGNKTSNKRRDDTVGV